MYSRFSHYHPLEDLVKQIVEDCLEARNQVPKCQRPPPPSWNVRPNLEEVVIGIVESYLEEKRQRRATAPCDCRGRLSGGVEYGQSEKPQCHICTCCYKLSENWASKGGEDGKDVQKNVEREKKLKDIMDTFPG